MTTTSFSSKVFVVLFQAGEYEDRSQKVVKAFSDRRSATLFVESNNDAIAEARGMHKAVIQLTHKWDKLQWSEKQEEEHQQARHAEETRLMQAIGLDIALFALKISLWDIQTARYFCVETELDTYREP